MIDQLLVAVLSEVTSVIHDPKRFVEFCLVIGSLFTHFLEARQNIWSKILAFPIAFTNIYVFSVKELYGKVIYSIIFVFFNLYAYLRWKGTTNRKPVKISRTSNKLLLSITVLSMLGGILWSCMARKYFGIASPISIYGDAFYFSFGFMDKWLMSHKKLERWIVAFFRYIAFAFACYQVKGAMLSVHYLILACIAVYGQIKWHLSYRAIHTSE